MTTVTFLNQPVLSEYAMDTVLNAKRNALVPEIENLVRSHPLFENSDVAVTFSHRGAASLVCFLDTGNGKRVLKIPLKPISKGEGKFLETWKDRGIRVPQVIEEGSIADLDYLLMDFIDALTVSRTYSIDELIQKEIYVELGALLRTLHGATSTGYGRYAATPEFTTFSSWLTTDERLRENILYTNENGILNEAEHGSFGLASEILLGKIGDEEKSVFCHYDFHIGNIFATEPFTVFDPNPFFNHPYVDLARSIVLAVKMGMADVRKHLVRGYFPDADCDEQLLQAALIVSAGEKLSFWHKQNRTEDVGKVLEHLHETRSLL